MTDDLENSQQSNENQALSISETEIEKVKDIKKEFINSNDEIDIDYDLFDAQILKSDLKSAVKVEFNTDVSSENTHLQNRGDFEVNDNQNIDNNIRNVKTEVDESEKINKTQVLMYYVGGNVQMEGIQHKQEQCYICNICKTVFKEKEDVIAHLKIHTRKAQYTCNICQRTFVFLKTFNRHKKSHVEEKSYKCKVCQKVFLRSNCLNRHKKIHSKKKPFKCNICSKAFHYKCNLKNHINIHTEEKTYKCIVCFKTYSRLSGLKTHKTIHTGEKPFKCNLCNKLFRLSQGLKAHLKIHSRNYRFVDVSSDNSDKFLEET